MNKDAKMGLLTILIVVCLVGLNSLREAGLVTFGGRQLGLVFSQVHGLRAGDLVTIGGVPSGRVVSIDFAPKEIQEAFMPLTGGVALVRAQVALENSRRIPKESTYAVRTDLNGRRWIEITVSPSAEEIGADETFFAESGAYRDDQLQITIRTFAALGDQTEKLRDVLADPEFRLRTKDAASNLRFYSRELRAASEAAPSQLRAMEESLDDQEAVIMGYLQSFDDKAKDVPPRMTEMSPQITESLKGWSERMTRQGDKLTATLEMAVARSDEYGAMIDRAVAQTPDPEAIQAMVVQTKKWARKLEEYRFLAEDLHALTSDPTVRTDLKSAIAKFKARSEQMNERLDRLEGGVDNNPLKPILGIPANKGGGASKSPQGAPEPAAPEEDPQTPPTPAAEGEDRLER